MIELESPADAGVFRLPFLPIQIKLLPKIFTSFSEFNQTQNIKLDVKVATILSLEDMVIREIPGLTVKYRSILGL
jgi:hypothetical protein